MENKVSSIIGVKQSRAYHQEESKSIDHQTTISLESISKKMSRMLDPPTKVQITFAWIGSMSSIIWKHEVRSCLFEEKRKLVENSENAC